MRLVIAGYARIGRGGLPAVAQACMSRARTACVRWRRATCRRHGIEALDTEGFFDGAVLVLCARGNHGRRAGGIKKSIIAITSVCCVPEEPTRVK